MDERRRAALKHFLESSPTRRTALSGVGAALALLGLGRASAQEASPVAGEIGTGPVIVQAFGHGTLFPTQGDGANLPPYTLILWDAADRGCFYVDRSSGEAGVIPTDRVLAAFTGAPEAATAVLTVLPADRQADQSPQVWNLNLVFGDLGADPDAVTYQGDLFHATASPAGAQDIGSGFLILSDLPGLDVERSSVLRLT